MLVGRFAHVLWNWTMQTLGNDGKELGLSTGGARSRGKRPVLSLFVLRFKLATCTFRGKFSMFLIKHGCLGQFFDVLNVPI
jgi:hypothetical protein